MAAILRDSIVVIVRTRPRAKPLAMITMRKSTHGFPFVSHMNTGLRLAAIWAAGAPLSHANLEVLKKSPWGLELLQITSLKGVRIGFNWHKRQVFDTVIWGRNTVISCYHALRTRNIYIMSHMSGVSYAATGLHNSQYTSPPPWNPRGGGT